MLFSVLTLQQTDKSVLMFSYRQTQVIQVHVQEDRNLLFFI